MTSNLGSDLIQEHHSEKDYDEMKTMLMEVLTRSFRPEFINRIDETVVFHPLGEEHIKSIARIQLKSLMSRLESQGFEVEVSEELLTKLVHAGFDPVYGARPSSGRSSRRWRTRWPRPCSAVGSSRARHCGWGPTAMGSP